MAEGIVGGSDIWSDMSDMEPPTSANEISLLYQTIQSQNW